MKLIKHVFTINDLINRFGKNLGFIDFFLEGELSKQIKKPDVQRAGLFLIGYNKKKYSKRILLFGQVELDYLDHLSVTERFERLAQLITDDHPLVILSRKLKPPPEMEKICKERSIPIIRSKNKTTKLYKQLTLILSEIFSPIESIHGTLLEIFGIGVLIQGDSSIGKSEAALGLIERGHRLVADDIVRLRLRGEKILEGAGPDLNRHLLEIRGIGIVNVAHLFGAVSVRQSVHVEINVNLEEWNDSHFYDRVGLEQRFKEFLGVRLPSYILPVKPGRDVVLLLETAVLNHRLKEMGLNSAKAFKAKLFREISNRQEKEKVTARG